MDKILRNTHLFLGLFLCLFIVTYGLSSIRIAHRGWVSTTPTIVEQDVDVTPEMAESPRALARALMDHHGLRGRLGEIRKNDAGFQFELARTGVFSVVTYNAELEQAHIRTQTSDFVGMLQAIHFGTAGLQTGYWLQDLWGAFVVLVSLGLIVLGGTGIYLWFKIHTERFVGGVLLAVGLLWGVTLIVLLYVA